MLHVHVGAAFALSAFASVVVLGFFWRLTAALLKDTPLGQGMAFIY